MKSEQKYLVLENDKPYKTMTASEVAEHFGLTVKRARSICSSGERFRRSYTVERIPEEAKYKPSIPTHTVERVGRSETDDKSQCKEGGT